MIPDERFRIVLRPDNTLEDNLITLIRRLEPSLHVHSMTTGRYDVKSGRQPASSTIVVRATHETATSLKKVRDRLVAFLKDTATAFEVLDDDGSRPHALLENVISISGVE